MDPGRAERERTQRVSKYVKMLAILAVAGLDAYAIKQGIDGVFFLTTIAIISGIAGNEILSGSGGNTFRNLLERVRGR